MEDLDVSSLVFVLKFVTDFYDWSCSIPISISRLNYFPLLTRPNVAYFVNF